ncbi:hypothetical protein O181_073614 [Austropuccinia psidii MF-1]|uniref:Uncharacterized protein n=1 Tax=Austropuccinia psidii MF-1 TaxID=1389203 RepID=A0A9Q3F7G4_9BASI|nr:hypothetical protein [Austropuccinia psidii MF-1]
MCRHCSAQTHSSPEGNRQVGAFKTFQYKQQIKNLKSAIEPKSLLSIHTSASGSEWPQIILDHIFPADYSQMTQSTFSTPPCVTWWNVVYTLKVLVGLSTGLLAFFGKSSLF